MIPIPDINPTYTERKITKKKMHKSVYCCYPSCVKRYRYSSHLKTYSHVNQHFAKSKMFSQGFYVLWTSLESLFRLTTLTRQMTPRSLYCCDIVFFLITLSKRPKTQNTDKNWHSNPEMFSASTKNVSSITMDCSHSITCVQLRIPTS